MYPTISAANHVLLQQITEEITEIRVQVNYTLLHHRKDSFSSSRLSGTQSVESPKWKLIRCEPEGRKSLAICPATCDPPTDGS